MSQLELTYSIAKFLATQCRNCDGTGKLKKANQSSEGYHYSETEPCLDCKELRGWESRFLTNETKWHFIKGSK